MNRKEISELAHSLYESMSESVEPNTGHHEPSESIWYGVIFVIRKL